MIEEIADCSQPCIKNTQHTFNPLAVSSRIFSPERRPEHLQFQLPLKKLTYSSRHENQASKFLLKLGPPFSEPCMELNPLIGKRLKQSSWDQQKQHQTTKIQSCLPISVSECVSGTNKCCLGWITGSDCVSHVFPSKLHLGSCGRINHYVGKSPPAKHPKKAHTQNPQTMNIFNHPRKGCIYILYMCEDSMAIPFSSQRYCKSGSTFLRRLDLPQCFLHSGIDGSLLAACRRTKTSCCLQEN